MHVGTREAACAHWGVVGGSGGGGTHALGPESEPNCTRQNPCEAGKGWCLLLGTWHLLSAVLGLPWILVRFSQRRASSLGGGDSGNLSAGQGGLPDSVGEASLGRSGCYHFKR